MNEIHERAGVRILRYETIDATDLKCPEPLMLLRQSIRKLQTGQSVGMYSSDEGTARDIPLYCQHMGHTLVTASTDSLPHFFVIKRGR